MPNGTRVETARPLAQPGVGGSSSVDEEMLLDVGGMMQNLKAALECHTAALEAKISGIVCDAEARLRAQTAADLGALRESVEQLRPAAALAQRFPGIAPCLRDHQEAEAKAELEQGPAKAAAIDEETGRETRRIVEECVGKLWELQGRSLDRVMSTWTQNLQRVAAKVQGDRSDEIQEQPQADSSVPSPRTASDPEPALEPSLSSDDEGDMCGPDLQRVRFARGPASPRKERGRVSKEAQVKDLETLIMTRTKLETMKNSHNHRASINKDLQSPETRVDKVLSIVEVVSTLVLVANVIWMAIATELSMQYVKVGEPTPRYFFWVDLSFVIAMCVEVITKLLLSRMDFFTGPGHRWNVFDAVLIILAAVDLLLSAANLSFVRVLRGLRAIRATRVIRTAHVVPELRLMFASVIASAASLFWAFVLILLVLLLCAMGVQQTVHSTLETSGMASQHPQLLEYYGSLPATLLSLFMAISGGTDWKSLSEPLVHISPFYILAYVLFIILTIFGLLNILTAVFVEKTSNISHIDPALVIEEKLEEEKASISQLLQIRGEADTDATGTISKDEFEVRLEDPRFRAQMQLLDVHVLEVQGIFELLDTEKSGEIGIEDLVYGLMLIRGHARSMDMHTIQFDTTRLLHRLVAFQHAAEASFKDIQAALAAQRSNPFAIDY